jgi:hypothetical protein
MKAPRSVIISACNDRGDGARDGHLCPKNVFFDS